MHRGSSKEAEGAPSASENLPLSASVPFRVTLEFTRADRREIREVDVMPGTLLRELLRRLGGSAEGSLVLLGETPVPLDTPLHRSARLVVIATFSGG